jgi:THO complex subunit 4
VGPLRDAFLIYNSQGKSKGMAVVTFQRSGDAAVARAKYDGKIVDGREFPVLDLCFWGGWC